MRSNVFDTITSFMIHDRNDSSLLDHPTSVLARIGCLFAVAPASPRLSLIFAEAIQAGIPVGLLEAAVIHAIGYIGLAPAEASNNLLQEVIRQSGKEKEKLQAVVIPTQTDERIRLGYQLYDRFDAGRAATQEKIYRSVADFYYPRAMEFAGFVLKEDSITLPQRQILTIAMLSCMGIAPQLKFHVGVALKNGISHDQVAAILLFVQIYGGLPRANTAALIIREAFERESE